MQPTKPTVSKEQWDVMLAQASSSVPKEAMNRLIQNFLVTEVRSSAVRSR